MSKKVTLGLAALFTAAVGVVSGSVVWNDIYDQPRRVELNVFGNEVRSSGPNAGPESAWTHDYYIFTKDGDKFDGDKFRTNRETYRQISDDMKNGAFDKTDHNKKYDCEQLGLGIVRRAYVLDCKPVK